MMGPKMRFKGFDGVWKNHTLVDIASFKKGQGYSKADLRNDGNPIILYGRMYTKYQVCIPHVDTYAIKKEGSVMSKGKEIIIPASGETAEDIACASVVQQKGVILGGDLNIIVLDNNYSPEFAALSLTYGKAHKELTKVAQGKTVVHLHNSEIANAKISFPVDSVEQCQIAAYFCSLDNLIQSTTKKITSLKQLKSASLLSMFPQAGETKPRVRFKGFKGDWKIKRLYELSKKVVAKNSNLKYNITLTNSAEYGIINQLDFFDHEISNNNSISSYYIVENDDFVYNPRVSATAPVGPINRNMLGHTGIMSPLYYVFKVYDINKEYLSYFFQTRIWHKYMFDNGNSGARFDRLSITDDIFGKMPIISPIDLAEQRQIASFFRSLDKRISLETQRLDKLKQIKSACLEKMFA